MIQKFWSHKPVRFIAVGLINTIIDFTLLNILVVLLHLPILLGNLISVSISVTVSYFLNHYIVFESKNKLAVRTYLKFFMVTGLTVIITQSVVIHFMYPMAQDGVNNIANSVSGSYSKFLLAHKDQLALNFSKALGVVCGLFINYVLYTKVVFKNKSEEEAIEDLMSE